MNITGSSKQLGVVEQEASWFKPMTVEKYYFSAVIGLNQLAGWGFSVCSLHVFLEHACDISSHSPNVLFRLTGDSKLFIGFSVNCCLSLCDRPAID